MKWYKAALGLAVLCLATGQFAAAAEIFVGPEAEDDYATIQEAIDNAAASDTVTVRDGTYAGEGNRDLTFAGKVLTVRSENGAEVCIIDCGGDAGDPHRAFLFDGGETAGTIIEGFSVVNAYQGAANGGAALCDGASPTITNCVFAASHSGLGGGAIACVNAAAPAVSNCTFTSCSADSAGGAVYTNASDPVISSSTLASNTSPLGAAVYCEGGVPAVKSCTIVNNVATLGGGIYVNGGTAAISNCTIADNDALPGGGIYCEAGTPTITNCILWDNVDELYGCSATYSSIEDGDAGTGNVAYQPYFVSPAGGDYHLNTYSPCINIGDNTAVTGGDLDVDGEARIADTTVDMGSDEVPTPGPDTDVDGLPDDWELLYFELLTDSAGSDDPDTDTRNNIQEWRDGTDPDRDERIMYVDATNVGDVDADGTVVHPYPTIQQAVDVATEEVRVAQGSYGETVVVEDKTLNILAGYSGIGDGFALREVAPHATTLDAQGVNTAIRFYGGGAGTLEGFIITGGIGENGGGVYLFEASMTVVNNIIHGNDASANGGGIYCRGTSTPNIVRNTIVDNTAGSAGGGTAVVLDSSPAITECILWDNSAPSGPQILVANGGELTVSYCDVQGGLSQVDYLNGGMLSWQFGNIDAAPEFAGGGDYHLKSTEGRYDPGSQTWVLDALTSPAIDAGNPASSFANEPAPNGGRVNIGAFGNTAFASKSPPVPGQIHGLKWHDRNGNGTQDAGEEALEGWTIYLDLNDSGTYDEANDVSTLTGPDGAYSFIDLELRSYTVAEEPQQWWEQTTPGGLGTYTVEVLSGTVATGKDFGNKYLGQPWYVDDDALSDPGPNNPALSDPAEDGSLLHPFDTVQEAIDAASDLDLVLVAQGSYSENIAIADKSLFLRGGWDTTFSVRDPETLVATLTEATGDTCVAMESTADDPIGGEVSGFTITGGGPADYPTQRGGGFNLSNADPLISDNLIVENIADEGGGLYAFGCSPTIRGNLILSNIADVGGGLSFVGTCSPILENNVIARNEAFSQWDPRRPPVGVEITAGVSFWTPNSNPATWGSPVLRNNTITQNVSGWAFGGVYLFGANAQIIDCIIYGNVANPSAGNVNLKEETSPSVAVVSYCNVEGGYTGTNNIDAPPDFRDPVADDYRLLPTSPCVDAGALIAQVVDDFEGDARGYDGTAEPRGDGSDYDIGADEFWPIADAGEDSTGFESAGSRMYVVDLDGSASFGANTYLWEQIAGLTVALRNGDTATPDFDAPQPAPSTELTKTEARLRFRLTINGGQPGEDSDEVEVYIKIPGDANGDDLVNAFDLALFRTFDPRSDFNGDNLVNAFDLAIFRVASGRKRLVD